MSTAVPLARLPRELARFGPLQAIAYDGLIALAELTGRWRYPAAASGDLETMRFLDKVYWFYKSKHPVRHAVRGSGLEDFFEGHLPALEGPLSAGLEPIAELSLSSVGDLMVHPYLARSAGSLFREVADLAFDADVAMGNLEFVVLDAALPLEIDVVSGPTPAFSLEEFRAVSGGEIGTFDFLAAACNHSLDFGERGVDSTISALRNRGIAFHGVNQVDADADQVTVLERRGVRLGLISHTFGLNGHLPPDHRPWIVNRMDLNGAAARIDFSPLERQLRSCVDAQVDFVVAHLHWGMEFEFYPRPEQLAVARRMAELGVDAIIGHHPHVLQPVEYYRTQRDPDRVVPIFYSLGNLTVPFSEPYLCRSGIARLDLIKVRRSDGATRTYVRKAGLVEVEQVVDLARGQVAICPRRPAPGE